MIIALARKIVPRNILIVVIVMESERYSVLLDKIFISSRDAIFIVHNKDLYRQKHISTHQDMNVKIWW